jgi:hypothetical protein
MEAYLAEAISTRIQARQCLVDPQQLVQDSVRDGVDHVVVCALEGAVGCVSAQRLRVPPPLRSPPFANTHQLRAPREQPCPNLIHLCGHVHGLRS